MFLVVILFILGLLFIYLIVRSLCESHGYSAKYDMYDPVNYELDMHEWEESQKK